MSKDIIHVEIVRSIDDAIDNATWSETRVLTYHVTWLATGIITWNPTHEATMDAINDLLYDL